MSDRVAWITPTAPSEVGPGHADYDEQRAEHLIASLLDRMQREDRGEKLEPAVRGFNVPDDYADAPQTVERPTVPQFALALSEDIAAESLSMSPSHFRRHVKPKLRVVKSGRLVLYPVAELERYMTENAARALTGR